MPSSNQEAYIRWDNQVTSPFDTLSRRVYPRTVREVFAWGEEMWMHHGTYSQAIKKAVRYFLTEVRIEGENIDKASSSKYTQLLTKNYDLKEELGKVGDDYIGFGNSFTSLHVPFTRQLVCTSCYFKAPLTKMYPYFRWESGKFVGRCPKCNISVTYKREDTALPKTKTKPVITFWPPQYMDITQHPMSRKTIYRIDVNKYEVLREGVMSGHPLYLEETPWEIIEAILNNQLFQFAPEQIFHLACPPITSLTPTLNGWGLPLFMAEFETALLVHMLDKYTESILVDHLVPFRILSPPQNANPSQDIMMQMDMGDFTQQVMRMIERHRQNPTDWNWLPTPLEHQILGGDATKLAPVEIMEYFEQRLLYAMGIPPEFYKGNAQASAGPILTFKMFEKTWQHFSDGLNKWLTWLVRRQGELLNWEDVTARLVPTNIYEDPDIREIKLSLAASNEISRDTAYRGLGIDIEEERKKVFQEEDDFNDMLEEREKEQAAKESNKAVISTPSASEQILSAEEQAAAAASGGMPPGGAPMPMPTGVSAQPQATSIEGLMVEAEQMAAQIIQMPASQRKSSLMQLASTNETLHAQVKSKISQMENQAATQGKEALRAGEMQAPAPV